MEMMMETSVTVILPHIEDNSIDNEEMMQTLHPYA